MPKPALNIKTFTKQQQQCNFLYTYCIITKIYYYPFTLYYVYKEKMSKFCNFICFTSKLIFHIIGIIKKKMKKEENAIQSAPQYMHKIYIKTVKTVLSVLTKQTVLKVNLAYL